jgi:hypothetical protein
VLASSPGLVALTTKQLPFTPSIRFRPVGTFQGQRGMGFDFKAPGGMTISEVAYRPTGSADASDTQFDQ